MKAALHVILFLHKVSQLIRKQKEIQKRLRHFAVRQCGVVWGGVRGWGRGEGAHINDLRNSQEGGGGGGEGEGNYRRQIKVRI